MPRALGRMFRANSLTWGQGWSNLAVHLRRPPGDYLHILKSENPAVSFEANVRSSLDFCNLEFEPECLEFHQARQQSLTTSAAQVRIPRNAEGEGRWRRYENFLASYIDNLAEFRRDLAQT